MYLAARDAKRSPSAPAPVSCRGMAAYLRLIDSCITQLKAQGPSRTCNESKEEEEEEDLSRLVHPHGPADPHVRLHLVAKACLLIRKHANEGNQTLRKGASP